MKKYASKLICTLACALLVLTDQLTKNWIAANLKGKDNIVWIKNVFELEYLENNGAAFSSFMGKQGFLITLTIIVTVIAVFEFVRIPGSKRYGWLHVAFTLLISGALGNLIDRVKQGYVVDFFYFVPINFPRFNVADICVTLAVPIFLILFFFVYKEEETEFLFKFKKTEKTSE